MRLTRRSTITILICLLIFILLVTIVRKILRFVHIFGTHPGVAVTQQEIWDRYHEEVRAEQHIPKKIHQVFHNWKKSEGGSTEIPQDWADIRKTCIDKNPGWEHKLWEIDESREFISKEYPWFLSTYDNYPFPVQRVDALKYFLMLHYGGIYIDMDNGCSEPLDSLLYYPTWITDGGHGTLSNNILGSAPNHPFYKQVTGSLIPWSYHYPFPYATVHYASGQWFLGAMWDQYHESLSSPPSSLHKDSDKYTNEPLIRVQMDMRPGSAKWVFFTVGRGGTWGTWDNEWFSWFGNQLVPQILSHLGLLLFGAAVFFAIAIACCLFCRRRRKSAGYAPVGHEDLEMLPRSGTE